MKKIIILASALALTGTVPTYAQSKKTKTKVEKDGDIKIKDGDTKVKIDGGARIEAPKQMDWAAEGFKRAESGLIYKIQKDVPGNNTPKMGDNIEMHINTHVGDSSLFNSRVLNDNQPVPLQIMRPSFKGDLVEGLMMMTPGDSASFLVPVDSLKKYGVQLMPWMQPGDMVQYDVVLLTVKTAEQLRVEMETKSARQKTIDDSLLQAYFKKNKLKPTKTSSGLYYVITKKGTGPAPKAGERISVNYTGKTLEGVTFDSNVDSAFHHVQPFTFAVGAGQVIKGWDEGLMLLNKGAKGTLFIPSGLAYGERSPSGKIPANGILVFDVELTSIEPAAAPPAGHSEHDGHQH